MPAMDGGETIQLQDSTHLQSGSDLGNRYRIESLLGQGGMGRVYKAYDKELDRTVAIKVVRSDLAVSGEVLQRFKQELLLASRISHRNILRIHDLGDAGSVKFITMAYVEGSDLQHLIRAAPRMPFDRIRNIAIQLCQALEAAHAEGVIHRDLKPQNVLIGKGDQVFVSDFGLAKSLEAGSMGMTRTGVYLGTPRYMSPEQVEGKKLDNRSDLYSLGLIFYEMATGDVPFTGDSTLQVMYQRVKTRPKNPREANPDIPDYFARIIMRCLEVDPAERYQNAREIATDLEGGRVSTVGARTVQITLPKVGRKGGLIAGAAIVVVLAGALAIPPVRRAIFGRLGTHTSSLSAIPGLDQGRFIAVVPFRILGDPQSLGYVGEGLQEALSSKLFQLKDVRMASDSAVAKVKPEDPLDKTARTLGVNLIVQGLLQGTPDNMRIIVNLEDVAEGKRIWSQEFSANSKDLLSIEDQISGQLVNALALKPTNEEMARASERPTDNVEAYDLYLRGRQALRAGHTAKNAQTAIDYFQQGIQKDAGFALAYSGLADACVVMYSDKKDSFWSEKALGAAQRAEQLKDDVPEVHFSLGSVYFTTGKSAEAIVELKRGLELAPNSDEGYRQLGKAYLSSGHEEEAIAAYKKALDVNPYYWANHIALGKAYLLIGQGDKGLDEFRRVTELEPENTSGWDDLGDAYERLGRYEESIPAYQKSIQVEPSWTNYSNLGNIYFLLRRYDEAVQMFQKAVELNPNQQMAVGNLADAYRWSGQKDKALATYDQAIALAFKDMQVNPQSTEDMGSLALYYAKKGDNTHAMDFIQRARKLDTKDVSLTYIQAIVEDLANQPDKAVGTLRDALSKGYPAKEAAADPELQNLAKRPEFGAMMKQFDRPAQ